MLAIQMNTLIVTNSSGYTTKGFLAGVCKETCPLRLRSSLTTIVALTRCTSAILSPGSHPNDDPAAGNP